MVVGATLVGATGAGRDLDGRRVGPFVGCGLDAAVPAVATAVAVADGEGDGGSPVHPVVPVGGTAPGMIGAPATGSGPTGGAGDPVGSVGGTRIVVDVPVDTSHAVIPPTPTPSTSRTASAGPATRSVASDRRRRAPSPSAIHDILGPRTAVSSLHDTCPPHRVTESWDHGVTGCGEATDDRRGSPEHPVTKSLHSLVKFRRWT